MPTRTTIRETRRSIAIVPGKISRSTSTGCATKECSTTAACTSRRILTAKVSGKKSSVDSALGEAAARLAPIGKDKGCDLALLLAFERGQPRAPGTRAGSRCRPSLCGRATRRLWRQDPPPRRQESESGWRASAHSGDVGRGTTRFPKPRPSGRERENRRRPGPGLGCRGARRRSALEARPGHRDLDLRRALAQAAAVVLPASSWAEADGTFVNARALSQISEKAIEPQGDSLPAWRLVLALAGSSASLFPLHAPRTWRRY